MDAGLIGLIVHWAVFLVIALRVIMMRPRVGVALAWLMIVATLPVLGVALYLLFGERRVGHVRADRLAAITPDLHAVIAELVREGMTAVDWTRRGPIAAAMNRLGENLVGVPTLRSNRLELFSDTLEMLRAIARDVDAATCSVHMEFYIWHEGGEADAVVAALVRAAERGVTCRILVDHIGGSPWLTGEGAARLREAGADVRGTLPTGLLTTFTSRNDLRMHRKIVVIDGRIAWTGSMNLVDPRYFQQEKGVGEWVDALVRVEGNAALALGVVFLADWQVETGVPFHELIAFADPDRIEPVGEADVQVIPSGPETTGDALLQMLIGMTYAAKSRLVLTTPYFVPDEGLKRALRGAAARGVEVDLIVPERLNFCMVHHASRSYFADLLSVGVKIHLFQGGLLHTKSITVDDGIAMIGTPNLDVRSLWLNFEVTLFIYDRGFTAELRALQEGYIRDSVVIEPTAWAERPLWPRLVENTVRLFSPLL